MKIVYTLPILILSLLFITKPTIEKSTGTVTGNEIIKPEFQGILDSANLKGAILVYDLQENKYYSNDFEWSKLGRLPASTFKIPNSIIALETGVVESDTTLFEWKGEQRKLKMWEQDLVFKDAFQYSCVPCYKEIARKIGTTRMTEYIDKFNYGSIKVDSTSIDNFWLTGESQITPLQQICFLRRFYRSGLPISERTEKMVKRMMIIEENDHFKVSGKTGWSIKEETNNGWFVGFIEPGNKNVYFFATNVEPKGGFNMDMFPMIRRDVTYRALKKMDIIK